MSTQLLDEMADLLQEWQMEYDRDLSESNWRAWEWQYRRRIERALLDYRLNKKGI